jgi:hypothetical protein
MTPSPFLQAIEEQLLERRQATARKRPQPTATEQLPLFG